MALPPEVIAYLTDPALLKMAQAADASGHDNIVLDCIKQQGWLEAQKAAAAREQVKSDAVSIMSSPRESDDECYRSLFVALSAKYMTQGTAVDPVLVAKDATDDAARLKAAMAAAWAVYLEGIKGVRG